MRYLMCCMMIILLAAACTPAVQPATSTPAYVTVLTCDQTVVFAEVSCVEVAFDALLLQTMDGEQATIQTASLNLTFDSTIYWQIQDQVMTIAVIEGVAIVGAKGLTKIAYAGTQVNLAIDGTLDRIGQPSNPQPYTLDLEVETVFLKALPRVVDLSAPVPTLSPTLTPMLVVSTLMPTPEACKSREDWLYFYTIQRGDNLSNIAQRYHITLQELQEGNCVTDPNRLQVGDTLRVPLLEDADRTATPMPRVVYYADSMSIKDGECTRLFWEVIGASVVYYEGVPASHSDTRNVCPRQNAVYTIRIIFLDGSQQDYQVEIAVD